MSLGDNVSRSDNSIAEEAAAQYQFVHLEAAAATASQQQQLSRRLKGTSTRERSSSSLCSFASVLSAMLVALIVSQLFIIMLAYCFLCNACV